MSKTVLCYGDSNTYGFDPETGLRYPRDVRWPGRLQILLGEDYFIVEEGCNGRTTIRKDPVDGWKSGLYGLESCLNSHKPIDIVVLMLGSNDLKTTFHLTAEEIASGAGELVDTIRKFTDEKQGFAPQIILVSPPEIGEGIRQSPFYGRFSEEAIAASRKFPACYQAVADEKDCVFFDAAKYAPPSEADSLHLTAQGHLALAEELAKTIRNL